MTPEQNRVALAALAKAITAATAAQRAIKAEPGPAAEDAMDLMRAIGGHRVRPSDPTIRELYSARR